MAETSDPDRNVRLVVQMLMAANEADAGQVAVVLGVARKSVYERLGGNRHFTIKDVRRLADYFKVDPGVFFMEPGKLIRSTSARSSTVSVDTVGYHISAGQRTRPTSLPAPHAMARPAARPAA